MKKNDADMHTAPRDCVVITALPEVAEEAKRQGRQALLHGRDFHDWFELRDRWSELTKRVGMAHVVGPQWLCQATEQLCNTTQINTNTGARRSRRWIEHTLRNLPRLACDPPAMKKDALKGMPAFIVGAGPSLDTNAHQLLFAQDRGIVIRINSGTAAPGQCAMTIESNDLRHKLFVQDELRLYGIVVPPSLINHGDGPLRWVWAGEIAWVPEQLTGIKRLPTSGSATTSAVALANLWGCDPIVLVGQDCAMPGGKVYADLTGHGDDSIDKSGKFHWGKASSEAPRPGNPLTEMEPMDITPAWGGRGVVPSTITQRAMRHWMEAAADQLKTPINATEGGANIPGWQDRRLSDVIDDLPRRMDTDVSTLAYRISSPLLPLDTLAAWLTDDAAAALADAWAMPETIDYLMHYRAQPPHRIGPWEQRTRLNARTALLALRESGRQDVERICQEILSGDNGL